MIVNAIYHGASEIHRVYHNGEIVFQIAPVEFHVIEDDKLIVVGAFSVVETADGLYLDCAPDVEWEPPVQTGNVLRITQVYSATPNSNVLEVQ